MSGPSTAVPQQDPQNQSQFGTLGGGGIVNELTGDPGSAFLPGLAGLGGTSVPTGTERLGVEALSRSTDPSRLTTAARDYFSLIASPAIRNTLTSAGLGRSGAEAEALSRGGVQMALPIAQTINQREAEMGQLIAQLGTAGANRQLQALLGGGGIEASRLAGQRGFAGSLLGALSGLIAPLQTGALGTGTTKTTGGQAGASYPVKPG